MQKPTHRIAYTAQVAASHKECPKKAELVDKIMGQYAELENEKPVSRETDAYWKKPGKKKGTKKG